MRQLKSEGLKGKSDLLGLLLAGFGGLLDLVLQLDHEVLFAAQGLLGEREFVRGGPEPAGSQQTQIPLSHSARGEGSSDHSTLKGHVACKQGSRKWIKEDHTGDILLHETH